MYLRRKKNRIECAITNRKTYFLRLPKTKTRTQIRVAVSVATNTPPHIATTRINGALHSKFVVVGDVAIVLVVDLVASVVCGLSCKTTGKFSLVMLLITA